MTTLFDLELEFKYLDVKIFFEDYEKEWDLLIKKHKERALYYAARVDRLEAIDKPYGRLIEKHVNSYDLDYNPFCDKKADRKVDWKAALDEIRRIRFNTPFDDSCFNIDFFNATSAEGEPLVGSARLPLRDLVLGNRAVKKKLVLTSPSGSPIGEVTVMVAVRRVENPLPPEKTIDVCKEERAVDDFDEHDLT